MAVKKKKSKKSKKQEKAEVAEEQSAPPSHDELLAMAQKFVKDEAKSNPDYKKVKDVVEATTAGKPARVVITCQDSQVDGKGNSVCEKTREIAIQDLHQVMRCAACQKRAVQIYRNELARQRRAKNPPAAKPKKEKKAAKPKAEKKAKKVKKSKKSKTQDETPTEQSPE